MTDLEALCRELHRNRHNNQYGGVLKSVIASPATRLALQQSEARGEEQPRLLHELVERYASNECQWHCDHVYALYSLVGDHRMHLTSDYAALPVQRLVEVVRFADVYEEMPPAKVLDFARLLVTLFRIQREELRRESRLLEDVHLVVPATLLGAVTLQPESEQSIALRSSRTVNPLQPMPTFVFDTSEDIWVWIMNEAGPGLVGREDMTYFSIADLDFHGPAACRLEDGDIIWHFPHTQLVFTVRQLPGDRALLLGRAYLFIANGLEPWYTRPPDLNRIQRGQRHISLNLATLLELGSFADLAKGDVVETSKMDWKMTRWLADDVVVSWKTYRHYTIKVSGFSGLIHPREHR